MSSSVLLVPYDTTKYPLHLQLIIYSEPYQMLPAKLNTIAMTLSCFTFMKVSHSFVFFQSTGRQLRRNNFSVARTSISRLPLCTVKSSSQPRFIHTKLNEKLNLELEIATIEDMEDVGAVLSVGTKGGDVLVLDGDLGAGKTCFSRGFVRARTGFTDMRVTSPTYLLSNTYSTSDDDLL